MKKIITSIILVFILSGFGFAQTKEPPPQPAGVVLSMEVTDFWTADLIKTSKQHLGVMEGVYYNLSPKMTAIVATNYGINKVIVDSVSQQATTSEVKVGVLYDLLKIGKVTVAIGGEVGGSWLDLSQDYRGAIAAFTKDGMLALKTSIYTGEGILYGRVSQSNNYTKGFVGIAYAVPLEFIK